MRALVTVSINYCDYQNIMPDYSERFILMQRGFVVADDPLLVKKSFTRGGVWGW
jgi:hypothetical protein